MSIWNTLTKEEKALFNEVLAESGYKYDPVLQTPMPLVAFGTRKHGDGYQHASRVARRLTT